MAQCYDVEFGNDYNFNMANQIDSVPKNHPLRAL